MEILQEHDSKRQVLQIKRTVATSPASKLFIEGNILLAICGEIVSRFREVEKKITESLESVTVIIWRDGVEHTIQVETVVHLGRVEVDKMLL